MSMEHKNFPAIAIKILDEDEGIVEHVVTVFGVLDLGNDISHPGAFTKTLRERGQKIRVLDSHKADSVMNVLGKPLEIREIGRHELPSDVINEYPEATGGVLARTQFFLDTPEGKGAFTRIKHGGVDEWSYGYDALDVDYSKATSKNGDAVRARNLRTLRLWEYSPVLWGMNPATATVSAKADEKDLTVEPAIVPTENAEPAEGKPWDVFTQDEEFCVFKLDEDGERTGDTLGCHPTEEEAQAQVAALYASEKADADKAEWSRAFINDLPDGSFLYIESSGEKDDEGKTTPRSLRHFPYKNADGGIDLPHLRNAIARIPQSNAPGLDDAKKEKLQNRARRMLEDAQKSDAPETDAKVGRVLARRNAERIAAALGRLLEVLEDAGVAVPGYGREDEPEEEEKQLDAPDQAGDEPLDQAAIDIQATDDENDDDEQEKQAGPDDEPPTSDELLQVIEIELEELSLISEV
jgi:HK97 family phage prohead protease